MYSRETAVSPILPLCCLFTPRIETFLLPCDVSLLLLRNRSSNNWATTIFKALLKLQTQEALVCSMQFFPAARKPLPRQHRYPRSPQPEERPISCECWHAAPTQHSDHSKEGQQYLRTLNQNEKFPRGPLLEMDIQMLKMSPPIF